MNVGLKDVTAADCAKLVIAYEPVWAIGTGKTATPDQAQEVHALIRATLAKLVGAETAETVRIQYGGSMKPGNAAELLAKKDIDGGLIGGAALKAADFAGIIAAAAHRRLSVRARSVSAPARRRKADARFSRHAARKDASA